VNYGANELRQRTKVYPAMLSNPLLYFVDRTVVRSAVLALESELSGADPQIGRPRMDRDAFWQAQLGTELRWTLRNYRYPEKSTKELAAIAAYCRDHGIRLHFIIFPTHVDVHRVIHQFGLDEHADRFKRDIAACGPTFDYDYENPLTENKDNFKDPLHFGPMFGDLVVREVFLNRVQSGKKL
jgi:hypothetical protein